MATNKETLLKFINDQSQKVQSDISQQGYKRDSPYVDRQQNIIQGQPGQPTPITMRGVDKTLLGTDEYGNQQIMHPGQEYEFPGSQVTEREMPVAQYGKQLNFLQPTSNKLPEGYKIPYNTPSSELAISIGGENGEPAYLIPSFKYGKPLADPIGEFRKTGDHLGGPFKTWQEAEKWEKQTRHPAVENKQTIMFPQQEFKYGGLLNKTIKCGNCGWSWKAADGGNDVSTCHKCGEEVLIKAQEGGPNQEAIEWTKKYVSSPKYKERITNAGYNNPDEQINRRLQNLENVNVVDTNNPQGTVYKPSRNTIETSYPADLEYYNIHKNLYPTKPELDSIIAHELGHSETNRQGSASSLLNKRDRQELKNRLVPEAYDDLEVYIDNYLKHDKSHHNVIPEENKSDLNSYRYDIRNQYDAGNQDFTKEHLEKSPSSFAKERLLKNYSDEDLIWLMNNVAQNNSGFKMPIAQKGGEDKPSLGAGKFYTTTGKIVDWGTPEYEKAYNNGEVVTDKGGRSEVTLEGGKLDEVVVKGKKRGFWNQSRHAFIEDHKDDGILGAIGSVATYPLGLAQQAMMYGLTDKVQRPSEVIGFENNEGWFANPSSFGKNLVNLGIDAATDPTNWIGVGELSTVGRLSKAKALAKLAASKESGLLSNTWKINPFANKTNLPEVGEIIKHPFRDQFVPIENISDKVDYFHLNAAPDNIPQVAARDSEFWNKLNNDSRFFIKSTDNTPSAVIDMPIMDFEGKFPVPMSDINKYRSAENIKGNPHWLQGHKSTKTPLFNSEINWSKWNKEIPDNPQLMNEYNAIEQTSKANGSWMKNADGSTFQGTPEQFVQQNSENFKNAFPNGVDEFYRGNQHFNPEMNTGNHSGFDEHIVFGTSNKDIAEKYATNGGFNLNSEYQDVGRNVDFYHPDVNTPGQYTGSYADVDAGMYHVGVDKNLEKKVIQGNSERWYNIDDPEVLNFERATNPNFRTEPSRGGLNVEKQINKVSTDNVASYIADKQIPMAKVKGIDDDLIPTGGKSSDVIMINPKLATPKSLIYNNGMFDMTNPNIYKTVVPGAVGLGSVGLMQEEDGGELYNAQYGGPQKYTEQNGSLFVTTKMINTPNGPRFYQAKSPNYNFSIESVDAKAITKVADSIPRINVDPRIIESLTRRQFGGAGILSADKNYQVGGSTVAEQYTQITGKPWKTAHTEGLTDGSAQQNLALIERLKQQLQPLQEPVVQEEKIEIVEEPVQPAMFNEDQLHRKELAKRVVEIAENRIKNHKYIDVPADLVKAALAQGEFANSCVGGVCDVFKEAGVMKSVDWSNTHFAKNAKEYGFTANNGWGIKSINNLEPGDMLQRNNHSNKDGNYYPGHSQIYLGKDANGKYRFFDNYNKEERTYYEDDIKTLLDPARKKTEPSASIYKVNPYANDNPYNLTPEEQIRAVEKSKMIKSESTSPASYNWKIADNAKNYNTDTKRVMDKFIDFANDNDKINELVKKTGKSKEEINDSLLNVFGEFGQENNWTTSKGKGVGSRLENIGESILTAFGIGKNLSVGPGQIKFNQIPADVRKSFNINSPNDLYDIEKVLPLMTALDLKDKEVLTNWGENNTLSSKLFGWKRDEYEDGYGNITSGGFTADELSADTDGSRLNNSVGRYSPYLRNQYSSIANNTITTGQNDYIPFNENTQQNYVPGRFNSGNEDAMIQSYTRDPGSYPYKVESNWRNNLERNVIKNEEGAVELPEIVVKSKKKI